MSTRPPKCNMSKIEFFVFPLKTNPILSFSNWISGIIFCSGPYIKNDNRFLSFCHSTPNPLVSAVWSAFLELLEYDHFSPVSLLPSYLEQLTVMLYLDCHNGLLTGLPASCVLFLQSVSHWFSFRMKSIILYYLALVKLSYHFLSDSLHSSHACLLDILQMSRSLYKANPSVWNALLSPLHIIQVCAQISPLQRELL